LKLNRSSCAEVGDAKAIAAVRAEKRSVLGAVLLPLSREHQDQELSPLDLVKGLSLNKFRIVAGEESLYTHHA
jgi:hypothetical protein